MQSQDLRKKLESVAYTAADEMRRGNLTRDEALKLLREEFPELEEEVYVKALAEGLFAAR